MFKFWSKKKQEKPEQSSEKSNSTSNNIFDDFSSDEILQGDVRSYKKQEEKNAFDYIVPASNFLKYFNIFMFLLVIIVFWYIHVQNQKDNSGANWLDPVCGLILWEIAQPSTSSNCPSITYTNDYYIKLLEENKKSYYQDVISIIPEAYENMNFANSRTISFLLEKTKNRLRPLQILKEFDTMKNSYIWIDKSKIQCSNISIDSENMLSMKCEAYAFPWENRIVGYNAEKTTSSYIQWSSMSVAMSFINYIRSKWGNFKVLSDHKEFSTTLVSQNESIYTNKTSFDLKLYYTANTLPIK